MKSIPASSARWMMRIDSSWSVSPQAPNIIAPGHRLLTGTPVFPRYRVCIRFSLSTSPGSAVQDVLGDGDRGHRPGPPGVEGEVDDDLLELLVGYAVLARAGQVSAELFGAAVGDQRRDG